MKKRSTGILILTVFLFIVALNATGYADDWRSEFDSICSKVQAADELSTEELQSLVKQVDELIPRVQSSGDPQSKVFIFRLKKCKDLFNFILDTRS